MILLIVTLIAAPAEAPAEETHWYGWQTILTDAGAIGFAALAGAHGSSDFETGALAVASGALYFAGGPAVHLAHGRWKTALGDFGLRVGVPFALGLLGGAITSANSSPGSDCPGCAGAAGFFLGALLGGVAASVLDAAWLAREPMPPAARARIAPAIGWMTGRDGEKHASLGLLAAF